MSTQSTGSKTDSKSVISGTTIVACIDGATLSSAVCDYAAWVARSVDAPLLLLHTIEHRSIPAVSDLTGALGLGASEDLLIELTQVEEDRSKLLMRQGKLMLDAAHERALAAGVKDVQTLQRHGGLSEALVELEEEIRVLVIGIRGEDHQSAGVGTQIESTVRALHRPILVVNREFTEPKKIMLAYDGSEAALKALRMVGSSPLFQSTPCHLVHVADDEDKPDTVLDQGALELSDAGIDVTKVRLSGRIEDALTTYQAEAGIDLTLMGAFSHNRVRTFLLGSFTASMLESTQRPLLLLR